MSLPSSAVQLDSARRSMAEVDYTKRDIADAFGTVGLRP
jgi:hypothetical protein